MHQMQKTEYNSTEMLEVSHFLMLIPKFFPHHLFSGQTFGMSHLIMKSFELVSEFLVRKYEKTEFLE